MKTTTADTERARMIEEQLIPRGIHDPNVLRAMGTIPRELFVAEHLQRRAYEDCALASILGQTISQPYIVAFMSQALEVQPFHRVLEIGTGTGYQTAVLSELARHVFTIERFEALSDSARKRLTEMGVRNVTFRVGDGSLGWPEEAPFDRIIVTAAAPSAPPALIDQLADGGRMVVPVGQDEGQTMLFISREGGRIIEKESIPVRFVKLVGQEGFEAP